MGRLSNLTCISLFFICLLLQVAEDNEEDLEDGDDGESAGVLDDETDEYDGTSPEAAGAVLNPNQEACLFFTNHQANYTITTFDIHNFNI